MSARATLERKKITLSDREEKEIQHGGENRWASMDEETGHPEKDERGHLVSCEDKDL